MSDVQLMDQELLRAAAALWVLAERAAGGSTLHFYTGLSLLHPHIAFPWYILMVPIQQALCSHVSSQPRETHIPVQASQVTWLLCLALLFPCSWKQ